MFGDPKRSIRDRFNYARPGERYDLGSPVFSTRPGRVQGTYQGTRNDFGANKRLETEVVFDDTFALVYTYGRTSATRPTLAEVGYTTRAPEHGGRWLLVGKDCRELGRFATGFQTSSCVSTVFDDSDTR